MENKKIYDNSIDNWIIIEPKKPLVNFIPLEEENYVKSRSAFHNGTDQPNTTIQNKDQSVANTYQVSETPTDFENAEASSLVSSLLPKKFAGVHSYMIPWNIPEKFANFFLVDIVTGNFNSFSETFNKLTEVKFFDDSDTNARIVNLQQGIQAVRIPVDRLKFDGNYKYGNYILKIAPKYIEVDIINLVETNVGEDLGELANNIVNYPEKKNTKVYLVDRLPFFNDTIWDFKTFPSSNSSYSYQTNRLINSVVEIYRNGIFVGKKTIISDDLNYNGLSSTPLTSNTGIIALGPDLIGWDPKEETINIGDTLRIFPRETYFDSINILIEFANKKQDFDMLLRFLQNDTVRNLKTGVFEVYDDNGLTIDSNGNINGTTIMKYQVSQGNGVEYRKRLADNA